jgi:CRISPR/Cas system-associated protein Cas7 (RAMP superfamily)
MPRHQSKNRINNIKASMSLLKLINPIKASPDICNKAEMQDKDNVKSFIDIIEVIKEEVDTFLKEIYGFLDSAQTGLHAGECVDCRG